MIAQETISDREREVLNLIDLGLTSTEAAKQLHIDKRTVDFHLSHAYRKLHVSNRIEALRAIDAIERIRPLIAHLATLM